MHWLRSIKNFYHLIILEILAFLISIIKFLNNCQSEKGGFGGGPYQQPHLAPTYAAINALCTLNCDRALSIIKRKELLQWIKSLKHTNGSFRMHEGGEEDVR